MSSTNAPSPQVILQHFSDFLHKLLQKHPNSSQAIQEFQQLQGIILNDPSNIHKIQSFLLALKQKYQPGPEQNVDPKSDPNKAEKELYESFLKTFEANLNKAFSSSVNRFTLYTFKDYVRKNSLRLPQSSSENQLNNGINWHISSYSELRDFLPDSQNFYRALGLGLIGIYLRYPQFTHNLETLVERVRNKEFTLSVDSYHLSSEDLRNTFCNHLTKLLEFQGSCSSFETVNELLFTMATKDLAFDSSIVSVMKAIFNEHLDKLAEQYEEEQQEEEQEEGVENSSPSFKEDLQQMKQKMFLAESGVVGDLMEYVPEIFHIKLVILKVEGKSITEVVYEPEDLDECLELHILNERYPMYQNFSLLTLTKDNNIKEKSWDYLPKAQTQTLKQPEPEPLDKKNSLASNHEENVSSEIEDSSKISSQSSSLFESNEGFEAQVMKRESVGHNDIVYNLKESPSRHSSFKKAETPLGQNSPSQEVISLDACLKEIKGEDLTLNDDLEINSEHTFKSPKVTFIKERSLPRQDPNSRIYSSFDSKKEFVQQIKFSAKGLESRKIGPTPTLKLVGDQDERVDSGRVCNTERNYDRYEPRELIRFQTPTNLALNKFEDKKQAYNSKENQQQGVFRFENMVGDEERNMITPKSTSKAIDLTSVEKYIKAPSSTYYQVKTEKVINMEKLGDSAKWGNNSQARISREEIEELKKRFGRKKQDLLNS